MTTAPSRGAGAYSATWPRLPGPWRGSARSGERRVGEEGRSRGAPDYLKKKKKYNSRTRIFISFIIVLYDLSVEIDYISVFHITPLSIFSIIINNIIVRDMCSRFRPFKVH